MIRSGRRRRRLVPAPGRPAPDSGRPCSSSSSPGQRGSRAHCPPTPAWARIPGRYANDPAGPEQEARLPGARPPSGSTGGKRRRRRRRRACSPTRPHVLQASPRPHASASGNNKSSRLPSRDQNAGRRSALVCSCAREPWNLTCQTHPGGSGSSECTSLEQSVAGARSTSPRKRPLSLPKGHLPVARPAKSGRYSASRSPIARWSCGGSPLPPTQLRGQSRHTQRWYQASGSGCHTKAEVTALLDSIRPRG